MQCVFAKSRTAFQTKSSLNLCALSFLDRILYLQALPSSGINIFAGQLHAHLSGRKIMTSQFRDEVKLSTIRKDFHYSTWNEQIVKVQPAKKIMPVIMQC